MLASSTVWNRFLTAFCRYFCANVSAVTKVNASSGHHLTHCGSFVSLSVQLLQVNTTFFSGCMFIAPNWHALMHHPQPLQAFSSTRIIPLFSSCVRASLGQAATHAGSSQCLQVIARFTNGPIRMARIRDLVGLKVFSLTMLQAYSQTTAANAFLWISSHEFSILWTHHFRFLLHLQLQLQACFLWLLSLRLRQCKLSLLTLPVANVQPLGYHQPSIHVKHSSRLSQLPFLRR